MAKKTTPRLPLAPRHFLFLLLLAFLVLHTTHSRLPVRLYFPFEKWPASRAPRPPKLTGARGPSSLHETATRRKFDRVIGYLITRYMAFHKAQRFNNSARKLIYIGQGNHQGFGDRFRGILNAYELAVFSQRVLLISWREPFPLKAVFVSAPGVELMYDPVDPGPLPITRSVRKELRRRGVEPPKKKEGELPSCGAHLPHLCTRDHPGMLLSDMKDVVIRSEATANVHFLLKALRKHPAPELTQLTDALAEWQSVRGSHRLRISIYTLMFRALLRPSPDLISRLSHMPRALREMVPPRLRPPGDPGKNSPGYIAVHARLGYGIGEGMTYSGRFNLTQKGASLRLVAACLAKAASEAADDADLPEPQTFYLATDTKAFSKVFRKEIRRWSRGAVLREMGGRVVHSNMMREGSRENRRMFVETGVELFFLAGGERLVSLPSGFSNLAKYLGDLVHRKKRVEQCVREKGSLRLG